MEPKVLILPEEGRRIRTPEGALVTDKGTWVVLSSYWRRLMANGDCRVATGEELEALDEQAKQERAAQEKAARAAKKTDKSLEAKTAKKES